jgi:2,4-diaminopentanoate dehydrogenase
VTSPGVAVVGTGGAGAAVTRACVAAGHRLVAGVTTTPGKVGKDLGSLTTGTPLGVPLSADLAAVLERDDVEVILYCGPGEEACASFLDRCADAGMDAVTISGMVHPPSSLGPARAAALHARAVASGARLVGTGANPGFQLDVLPAVLASASVEPLPVCARRVSEIGTWGAHVLATEVGVGGRAADAPDFFIGSVKQSLALLGDALGLLFGRLDERSKPVLAERPTRVGESVVEPGAIIGFDARAVGWIGQTAAVDVHWTGAVGVREALPDVTEGLTIEVGGEAGFRAVLDGSLASYAAAAARTVNAIRPLRALPPGLYRPDELAATAPLAL